MKTRTTLMLDEIVVRKLQAECENMSLFVNELLKEKLFGRRQSMLGAFKGVRGADKIKEDD